MEGITQASRMFPFLLEKEIWNIYCVWPASDYIRRSSGRTKSHAPDLKASLCFIKITFHLESGQLCFCLYQMIQQSQWGTEVLTEDPDIKEKGKFGHYSSPPTPVDQETLPDLHRWVAIVWIFNFAWAVHLRYASWPQHYRLKTAHEIRTVYSGSFWIETIEKMREPALATEANNRSVLILLHRPHFSLCPSFICPSLICTLIMTDRCVARPYKKKTCSDTPTPPTDEDLQRFFLHVGPSKESDAIATSTGTLRQHLHSRPDLNDHSSQWENFNGAPGRKEAASLLILGTVQLRWNAGKGREEAWRGGKVLCLSLSRLSASCLFLTIITPCIRYERESHSSLILWIISPSLPVPSPASPFLWLSLSFSPPSPSVGTWVNKQCCVGC